MRVLGSLLLVVAACHPPGWGKEEPPVDAGAPDGEPGPDSAPPIDSAAPVTCEAAFELEDHGAATSVWLTGDFIGWAGQPSDGAVALTLDGAAWRGSHTFDAGTYQYKFIVDGATWIADPGNPDTIDDGFGGTNSVYVCN